MTYDFDTPIDRSGSCAMKWEALRDMFGRTDLTPLWIADMDFAVCPEITEALERRCCNPVLGYCSTPATLWEAVCSWLRRRHGIDAPREWLSFVPGIVRGIGFAINWFTRPGDKIVIQPPVYHPFRNLTVGNGRVVVENPLILGPGDEYRMDLEGLEKIFATEHPRMMILCNPHNPGGIQWSADTLREVASLAKRHGVVVVSDEIHGDLMLFGNRHIPFASVSPEAAEVSVTFGAPSKTFNIAGLAASWMMVPDKELREGFFHWMEVNEFSEPTFTAAVGAETAYRCGEEWLNQCLAYIEGNILAVEEWLKANLPVIYPVRPQSSFLIWLDCRQLRLSQEKLVDLFVNRAHLALNDGTMFGRQAEGFMRLNVGLPRRQLISALEHLASAVNEMSE
ncbi:MAG: pyridoxal phosphate-dependent aminotransferase [Pseudoflavonifractor sp.]|nr:pyridoxal phosphate-dependent aminotransferase [Alloprevotella sp.]MCM1117731.1 pyridoxal phosphate-dependent aminotransferase [Pseudoflavonifractor sp.]